MKKASIIVVTYNSTKFISHCLKSLESVKGIEDSEIIVWDNASTDKTVEQITQSFPNITVHSCEHNLGFAQAVNQASRLASGTYLVLLNPDTTVEEEWLVSLIKTFNQHTKVGAVNSKTKIIISGKEYIQNAGSFLFSDGHARDRGAVVTDTKEQLYEPDSEYYSEEREVDAFSGVSVAIPRELFLKLGGFDINMFLYYEDTDLSIRLKKLGYTIWYQPKSKLTHIHSASSREWSEFFVFHTELNRLLLVWKHFPLNTVLSETALYKASTFFQIIKNRKRFFTRLKVLFNLVTRLPYLLHYRMEQR